MLDYIKEQIKSKKHITGGIILGKDIYNNRYNQIHSNIKSTQTNNIHNFNKNSDTEIKFSKNDTESDYAIAMHKMAHEFGNALTLINSSLQIIASSHPEVQTYKYWSSTISDVHYLIDLVAEVSLLGNSHKLHLSNTNLVELLRSIVDSFSCKSVNKDINLTLNATDNIPCISADSTKLRQVFINLIKNAYESFTETKDLHINISITSNNSNIIINISDNGCGIPDELQSQIFSPMVSFKENGTGLGLPISKRIIEAHNGTLTFESKVNIGTTFHIILPI